jgi:GGDEF domain-containing protein
VARWDGDEPAELVLARAQNALAAAKSAGRNVTLASE